MSNTDNIHVQTAAEQIAQKVVDKRQNDGHNSDSVSFWIPIQIGLLISRASWATSWKMGTRRKTCVLVGNELEQLLEQQLSQETVARIIMGTRSISVRFT